MFFYTKSLFRRRPPMAKILLVMRLIIVLLTTAILQVSAAGYAQKVTLIQNNARLTTVLDEIRKQTGYDFVYSDKVMNAAKRVSLNLKNAELNDALEICFKDQPLSFKVEDKMVVIKPKEASFIENIIARFQSIDIYGRVVDENGSALAGASVKVKGKSQMAVTNGNGEFLLQDVTEDAMLEISYVGYMIKEVKAGKNLGVIALVLVAEELQEVIVNKGYYSTKQELNTGSVSTLKAADIAKQPV